MEGDSKMKAESVLIADFQELRLQGEQKGSHLLCDYRIKGHDEIPKIQTRYRRASYTLLSLPGFIYQCKTKTVALKPWAAQNLQGFESNVNAWCLLLAEVFPVCYSDSKM